MDRRGKLVRQITREREAIRRRLRMMTSLRASANGFLNGEESPVGDPESALKLAQQEVLIDQEMRAYERLASRAEALEQAWESFQRGTYGICRQCRGQIPQRRLQALPGAALCLSCQEEEEQAVGGRPDPGWFHGGPDGGGWQWDGVTSAVTSMTRPCKSSSRGGRVPSTASSARSTRWPLRAHIATAGSSATEWRPTGRFSVAPTVHGRLGSSSFGPRPGRVARLA